MNLGLSLSLGAQRGTPPQTVARNTICKAIKDRKHVVATIDGGLVLLEPYVVMNLPGDGLVLEAVPVLGTKPKWKPRRFPLKSLSGVKAHHLGFIPNGSFDPADPAYSGAVCVVEPFQSIDDALKGEASGG